MHRSGAMSRGLFHSSRSPAGRGAAANLRARIHLRINIEQEFLYQRLTRSGASGDDCHRTRKCFAYRILLFPRKLNARRLFLFR